MQMLYAADDRGFRAGDSAAGAGLDMYVDMHVDASTPSGWASTDDNVYVMPSFFEKPVGGDKGLLAHEAQHVRGFDGRFHNTNESNLAQALCS